MDTKKIAYEPHPVSPERKAELRAAGYQIIDAVFNPNPVEPEQADKPKPGRKPKAVEPEQGAE